MSDREKARARAEESNDYLNMALNYLAPEAPRLIAVGGLSGSGKSRMARELAPFLGVVPGPGWCAAIPPVSAWPVCR